MRFLLDTNLLSETVKPRPDAGVTLWIEEQAAHELAVSALTLGEIWSGIIPLDYGRRKMFLVQWLSSLPFRFFGRVLPVDEPVALEWGRLTAESLATGRPIPAPDALLVATALARNLTLVTRNERHCAGWGAPLINPWSGETRD